MKLLYITNGITGIGGLERVLAIKASYLADNYGYDVHILTLNEKDKQPFYALSPKIRFYSIPYTGIFSYLSGLRKTVREIQPDIISVCDDGLKGFFVPLYLAKPCVMIYEKHAPKIILKKVKSKSLFKKMKSQIIDFLMNTGGKLYDKFIVLTEKNKLDWKKLSNIEVIANPLTFYPNQTSSLKNKKAILVGSYSYSKGLDIVIETWEKVVKIYPDWVLEIYGKNDEANYYQRLVNKYQMEKNVLLFAPVSEIEQKYLDASIYVMSSRYEGFGMVLTEAMACGLPCVSFDCPYGPSDIITEGEDGFLVASGDINQLSEKICFLIANNEERFRMGQNAKENVKRYLPENIMPQWDILFQHLPFKKK